MSQKSELADAYHQRGYGCAQSVLAAFCRDFNLEEETAIRIAVGFGGGMGRMCEVCGALTGSFMVIGLKYGRVITDGNKESANKEQSYALVYELARRFRERNSTIYCRELTGFDLNDPDQRKRAKDQGIFDNNCAQYIRDAVEILEEVLSD